MFDWHFIGTLDPPLVTGTQYAQYGILFDSAGEPVWKDTLIMREGWTEKIVTHYKDFIGSFVQHCHILNHEDQGMMELIEIQEKKPNLQQAAARTDQAICVATPYRPDDTTERLPLNVIHILPLAVAIKHPRLPCR